MNLLTGPRLLLIAVFAILLAACSGESPPPADPAILENLDRADHFWSIADTGFAMVRLEKVLALDPDSFEALYRRGVIRTFGRSAAGLIDLQRAARLRPDHPGPRFYAAMNHLLRNQLAEADREMNAAFSVNNSPLGFALADTGEAIRQGLAEIQAGRFTGAVLSDGNFEQALASFDEALGETPRDAPLLTLSAYAAYRVGQHEEAESRARRVLGIDPDFVAATAVLGAALCQRGSNEEGLATLDRAVAAKPDLAFAHHERGSFERSRNEYRAAVRAFWLAALADPLQLLHHEALGLTFMRMTQTEQGAFHLGHRESLQVFLVRRARGGSFARPR